MPMFLFSGTFFPIDQLHPVLQPVAWVTPLWHGVELCPRLHPGHRHLRRRSSGTRCTSASGSCVGVWLSDRFLSRGW